jgi:toxin ParE1/3/4
MLDVIFRPAAEDDVRAIADYTKTVWGDPQAKSYLDDIQKKIVFAAQFPGSGSAVYGLPEAYRKMPVGSHRIIYRIADHQLIVVRILHEREDIPRYF